MTGRFSDGRSARATRQTRRGGALWGALLLAATLLTPTSVAAEPVPIEVASSAQKEVAQKQFQLGVDLFKANKFDQALGVFRMSLDKVSSPNTRLMVARTLAELKRYPEAHVELSLVLVESEALARGASKYKTTVEAARAELEVVRQHLAFVELETGVVVAIDGKAVSPVAWGAPLVLTPRKVTIELVLSNGQKKQVAVELQAGGTSKVDLRLPPPVSAPPKSEPEKKVAPRPVVVQGIPRSHLGWTGVGFGTAGAVGFTVFGLLARDRYQTLDERCPEGRCPESLREVAEEGRFMRTMANVSLGVGVTGFVVAAYFFLTDDPPAAESSAASGLGVGPGSVSWTGRF